jgi:type IV secretory pathway TrbL component
MRPSPGFADPDCSVSDQPQYYSCYRTDLDHCLFRLDLPWVGAAEWTRDMSVGYYKTMLCFGIKLMVTLLLAGIGLDILHTVQAQPGQGWGTDLALLAKAMAGSAILLGIIAKAPDAVASIAGVSTGGLGHGVGTFVTAAGLGYQAGE